MKKNFFKMLCMERTVYSCETWAITEQNKKKLEAMKMWMLRKLLKVS